MNLLASLRYLVALHEHNEFEGAAAIVDRLEAPASHTIPAAAARPA